MNSPSHASAMTTTQLRRFAEAIESAPAGKSVWVVARREFPHTVNRLADSEAAARAAASRLGGDYEAVGPFTNQRPPARAEAAPPVSLADAEGVWIHTGFSEWIWIDGATAASTSLVTTRADGSKVSLPYGEFDAVAIGPAAHRKFVSPYLLKVYGMQFAYDAWRRVEPTAALRLEPASETAGQVTGHAA